MSHPSVVHAHHIPESDAALIAEIIAWLSPYLPHQGTLQHFVHHNPLGIPPLCAVA
jgi:hypothetical protein